MSVESCEVDVKVLSVVQLTQFEGEAILAHSDPKFVVALLLKDSKSLLTVQDSAVSFAVHWVAFFAIHSVARLFIESSVVGRSYRLHIETETIRGRKKYALRVV